MSIAWTTAMVAAGLGGRLVGDGSARLTDVAVDSRLVRPASLFVAMHGEHADGHDFVSAALGAGAGAVVVDRPVDAVPRIEVSDTATALRNLAAMRRNEINAPVVAVTGSTGKTSTKDLLAHALPGAAASPKSYNNEVGVPLTILGAPDADYLVVEVGSRGVGHITWLMPAVRPDVSIITNLGVVHLETFGTTDALADAKWELVAGLGPGGTAVLPVDEPRLRRPHEGDTLTFGREVDADVGAAEVIVDDTGCPTFTLVTPHGNARVHLQLAGEHQVLNAAAATAAGLAVGVDLATLASGLEQAEGSAWRMEIHHGRYTVVNDAYNANPTSVRAALRTVAALPGRHIAVLGKMAELGSVEAEEHRRMGAEARELGYAAVLTVGDDPGFAEGAGDLARSAADQQEALEMLSTLVRPGDVVLVKASRAIGLEALAEALRMEADA